MEQIPDIRYRITIRRHNKEVGYIQMVFYYGDDNNPHIEYELTEGMRGQGIMSEELPKYLKFCESLEHKAFIALVKKDNIASKRLLEKNKFVKIANRKDDIEVYIFTPKLNKLAKEILDSTLESVSSNYVK